MRTVLDNAHISEQAMKAITENHANYVAEVRAAISENKYVIVGMKQNPVVSAAKKNLEAKNISYKYIENGSYFSMWKQRLAIKLWSGWPTFPMVFIEGKLIGGNKELKNYLALNN
jgi:glutaredoxin-related protein